MSTNLNVSSTTKDDNDPSHESRQVGNVDPTSIPISDKMFNGSVSEIHQLVIKNRKSRLIKLIKGEGQEKAY